MATALTNSKSSAEESTTKPQTSKIQLNVEQQCPIQYVTVYNDRAEVTRLVRHHFDGEGTYDLVFQGFSPSVDLTSLHVSGGTGKACTILEVSYQTRYEDPTDTAPLSSAEQLQNELAQVQSETEQHQRELARLGKQRVWLDGRASKLMNQDGQVTNNDLEAMQQFMEFYYKTLIKLDDDTAREDLKIKQLIQRQTELKTKINEHGADGVARRRKAIREVTVTVHLSSSNTDVTLDVSYLISNCSWSASYDVRVNSSEASRQKTQLTYYGSIVNKSQENWSDVQLSLSTATPSLGGVLPKLPTLKIGFYVPRRDYDGLGRCDLASAGFLEDKSEALMSARSFSRKSKSMSFRARSSLNSKEIAEENEDSSETERTVNVLGTNTEASMSSSSFAIPRRSTIDADGKPHKVTIGVLDLTSTFTYTVIPKSSTHAYLKASTTNTSDKQLLAGPVSVFMDNNFVTHSTIGNVCLGDTFDLSLGTDASVKVDYKPVKKVTDTQGLISKVKHESIRHETRLVNTKATEVTVFVYEQVPRSSYEKIKVKLILPELRTKEQNPNCTVTLNDSNNLEWKCILQPRGECRLPMEYTLEWPIEKRIEFTEE